jgi:hypothetical protein
MTSNPLMNNFEDVSENMDETSEESYNPYDYNENLTAKLGGNYAKIIEFYDSKL